MAGQLAVLVPHRQSDRLRGQQPVQHQLPQSSRCILAPGIINPPANKLQFDQLGIPSIFANTSAGNDFVPGYSGNVGYRGMLRGLPSWNDDMSISKVFKVHEKQASQFPR